MKRTALIFDLDGTLVHSAPDLRLALNVTLRELHRREVTLDEVRHMLTPDAWLDNFAAMPEMMSEF